MNRIRFLILLCIIIPSVFSQIKIEKDSLLYANIRSLTEYPAPELQIIPPSPQAQIFEKYINHEVSGYSGIPEIEIPLYEMKIKGVTIPITLSYHASGVKYKQFDGDIGAGWSINAGGYRISRTIYGRSDFRYHIRYDENKLRKLTFDLENAKINNRHYKRDAYLGSFCLSVDEGSEADIIAGEDLKDGEYDQFSYLLPTTRGHFIFSGWDPVTIEIAENNQDIVTYDQGFGIKDKNGNNFQFNKYEWSNERRHWEKEVTSWLLTDILNPYDQKISFDYLNYTVPIRYNWGLVITDYPIFDTRLDSRTFSSTSNSVNLSESEKYVQYNEMLYINKIEDENTIIEFERNATVNSKKIDYLLKEIRIWTKSKVLIKRITFNYETFPENVDPKFTAFEIDNNRPYHILLKSIQIGKNKDIQNYNFEYYNPQEKKLDKSFPDKWGFYSFKENPYYTPRKPTLNKDFSEDKMIVRYPPLSHAMGVVDMMGGGYCWVDRNTDSLAIKSFSLKKIIYPTGGYTEYDYEPNMYKPDNKEPELGAGLRIRKIKSFVNDLENPIVSIYKYGSNENGIGKSRGGIESIDYNRGFCDLSFYMDVLDNYPYDERQPQLDHFNYFTTQRIYATNSLFKDMELYSQIFYPEISIYKYNDNSKEYLGKEVLKYTDLQDLSFSTSYNKAPYFKDFIPYSNDVNGFYTHSYRLGQRPLLDSVIIYNNNDFIVKDEHYQYEVVKEKWFEGFVVCRIIIVGNYYAWREDVHGLCNPFEHMTSQFRYNKNYVILGEKRLKNKKINEYFNNKKIYITETYEYDDKSRLINTTQSNSEEKPITKGYVYPALGTELEKKNMVSTVVETITKNDGIEIGRIKDIYPINAIQPSQRQISFGEGEGVHTDIKYDLYDIKGNILQYTRSDGTSISYLWSYNYLYPIAEIQNATYEQISKLIDIEALSKSIEPDMNLIEELRTKEELKNVLITTYTYKPLVGMISSTDPRGVTTYYEYDDFNRLKNIRDKDKHLVELYQYNYVNKTEGGNEPGGNEPVKTFSLKFSDIIYNNKGDYGKTLTANIYCKENVTILLTYDFKINSPHSGTNEQVSFSVGTFSEHLLEDSREEGVKIHLSAGNNKVYIEAYKGDRNKGSGSVSISIDKVISENADKWNISSPSSLTFSY